MAAENEVELTPEDKKYLKQLAQDHREQQGAVDEQGRTWTLGKLIGMGFSRRDAMAILSGIAVGIPFSQAVMQRVRAAASTSDSDGNVGLPADRVDVFADGVDANSVDTDDIDINGNGLAATGDFLAAGPCTSAGDNQSTTSTSYVSTDAKLTLQWDQWAQSADQTGVLAGANFTNSSGDIRVQNTVDDETAAEALDVGLSRVVLSSNYTPTTTGSPITLRIEIRTNDGGTSSNVFESNLQMGVQV